MGQCITPNYTKLDDTLQAVPCGKCPDCFARRIAGWSFRLLQEEKRSSSAWFVTFTYKDDYLPVTEDGEVTLCKKHLQDYFKRLRKRSEKKIKYYAIGEYGGRYGRPHYHAIIFNAKFVDIEAGWSIYDRKKNRYHRIGQVFFGDVSPASIGYVLGYLTTPRTVVKGSGDSRTPEFSNMSKGLGLGYVTDAMTKWHLNDLTERMYVSPEGDKKVAMPRYYRDRIYDDVKRSIIATHVKNESYRKAYEFADEMYKQHGHDWGRVVRESNLYKFDMMYKRSKDGRKTF